MQKKQIETPKKSGFTLIEILVVIGLIAILATIVIIAINPARQFAQGRDTQRTANTNAILNAIGQYTADHKGDLPADVPAATTPVVQTPMTAALCGEVMPLYIPSFPTEPQSANKGASLTNCTNVTTAANIDYTIGRDSGSRVTICAPAAVNEEPLETAGPGTAPAICVTR